MQRTETTAVATAGDDEQVQISAPSHAADSSSSIGSISGSAQLKPLPPPPPSPSQQQQQQQQEDDEVEEQRHVADQIVSLDPATTHRMHGRKILLTVDVQTIDRQYFEPGDIVRGSTTVSIPRRSKIFYIKLRLAGCVQVNIGRQRIEDMFYEDTIFLWGTRADPSVDKKDTHMGWAFRSIEPGEHHWDFEFQLPTRSLPSSTDFLKGEIIYTIETTVIRPTKFLTFTRLHCATAVTAIQVRDIIDVSKVPAPPVKTFRPLETPSIFSRKKKKSRTSPITIDIEIPKAGFLRGETINMTIKIQHVKPIKNLRGGIVTFYRRARFQGKGKDLAQTIVPLLVNPKTLCTVMTPKVIIPAEAFPTNATTPYVSFRYFLEIVLDLSVKSTVFEGYGSQSNIPVSQGFTDTSIPRKDKSVIVYETEIVVGTHDKRPPESLLSAQRTNRPPQSTSSVGEETRDNEMGSESGRYPSERPPAHTDYFMSPTKAQYLAAEQALLPSQPSTMEHAITSSLPAWEPSAPPIESSGVTSVAVAAYDGEQELSMPSSSKAMEAALEARKSAPPLHVPEITITDSEGLLGPSAPPLEDDGRGEGDGLGDEDRDIVDRARRLLLNSTDNLPQYSRQ